MGLPGFLAEAVLGSARTASQRASGRGSNGPGSDVWQFRRIAASRSILLISRAISCGFGYFQLAGRSVMVLILFSFLVGVQPLGFVTSPSGAPKQLARPSGASPDAGVRIGTHAGNRPPTATPEVELFLFAELRE